MAAGRVAVPNTCWVSRSRSRNGSVRINIASLLHGSGLVTHSCRPRCRKLSTGVGGLFLFGDGGYSGHGAVDGRRAGLSRRTTMLFRQYDLACLSLYSYLIGDTTTGRAVVVDPQRDIGEYLTDADANGLRIERVIETHLH